MHYHLRDGLSWCLADGRAVFLDLPADRYFRLRPEDDRIFQHWASAEGTAGLDPDGLIGAGILVASTAPQPPQAATQVPAPSIDLAEEAATPARAIDIVRGLVAQRRASLALRRGRLARAVDAIRSSGAPPPTNSAEATTAAERVAATFASTLLSFHKSGQCLPRALAAQALCRRAGVAPTLVFGVRLEPFAAHCWLQLGTAVIVGDLEQARTFIPILAVP